MRLPLRSAPAAPAFFCAHVHCEHAGLGALHLALIVLDGVARYHSSECVQGVVPKDDEGDGVVCAAAV